MEKRQARDGTTLHYTCTHTRPNPPPYFSLPHLSLIDHYSGMLYQFGGMLKYVMGDMITKADFLFQLIARHERLVQFRLRKRMRRKKMTKRKRMRKREWIGRKRKKSIMRKNRKGVRRKRMRNSKGMRRKRMRKREWMGRKRKMRKKRMKV